MSSALKEALPARQLLVNPEPGPRAGGGGGGGGAPVSDGNGLSALKAGADACVTGASNARELFFWEGRAGGATLALMPSVVLSCCLLTVLTLTSTLTLMLKLMLRCHRRCLPLL